MILIKDIQLPVEIFMYFGAQALVRKSCLMEAIIARAYILLWKKMNSCRKVTEESIGRTYTIYRSTVLLPRLKSRECGSGQKDIMGPKPLKRC